MKVLAFVVSVVAWLAVGTRPADACGKWTMTDTEHGVSIGWLINAGELVNVRTKKRLRSLYLEDSKRGLRLAAGGKVRWHGKTIATIDADGDIVVARHRYELAFTDEHELHDMPAWNLTVSRDGKAIIESTEATALCAVAAARARDQQLLVTEQQAEIRLRVAYYLAWRHRALGR